MEYGTIRLSDLAGKNIVNIYDGVRLGVIYEPNLSFDPETGKIEQLYLGGRNGFTGLWSEKNSLQIPWQAVLCVSCHTLNPRLESILGTQKLCV